MVKKSKPKANKQKLNNVVFLCVEFFIKYQVQIMEYSCNVLEIKEFFFY